MIDLPVKDVRPRTAGATPLGARLVEAGLLSEDDLQAALAEQRSRGQRLGEILSGLGFVDEEDLLPFLGDTIDVPTIRLREGLIDPTAVKLIPRHIAEKISALALFKVFDELTVAFSEPQNLIKVDQVERLTGCRVRPVLALQSAIERLLPRCYEDNFSVDTVTADMEADAIELHPDAIEVDLQDVRSMADGSPVVNLVNYVIVNAVRQRASDIHFEPGQRHSSIRFRVDGQLREILRPRKEFHPAIISRIKVMAKMDIAEQRLPQDGRMHVVTERLEIDLRCSTIPTVLGEKAVLRVLDRENVTFHLNELGMPDGQLAQIKTMLAKPYGLILVTGPTGSGKTTTLYSAVELIKTVHSNIVTVEDPVEYQIEMINQVQTGGAKGMTFANVLRSILRQDPDVIMVGEIRDVETAEVAIQAALTGHLVLSTLHTNDSAGAVTRLLDMGIAPYKISAALVGVVAQRLVRKLCKSCQTNYYPTAEYLDLVHYQGDRRRQFVRSEGCAECAHTGFRGRVGLFEIFEATRRVREMISAGADLEKLRDAHRQRGGTTLLEEGLKVAEEGKTSLEEVARVALFE